MAHSFMLALVDLSIDATRMFDVQGYVDPRLRMIGYDEEVDEGVIQDAMVYNTRA